MSPSTTDTSTGQPGHIRSCLLLAIDTATGAILGHTTVPIGGSVPSSLAHSAHSKRTVERLFTKTNSGRFVGLLHGVTGRGRTFALDATQISVFDCASSACRASRRRLRGPQRYLASQRNRHEQLGRGGQQ